MKVWATRLVLAGLLALAIVGVCAAGEEETSGTTTPPLNTVVIGILDIDINYTSSTATAYDQKKVLIKDFQKNPRVTVVNIHDTCSLSNLIKGGYERAEQYKKQYGLDIILQTNQVGETYYFNLVDLYRKKVKEVSRDFEGIATEIALWRISRKLLSDQDIDRVLEAKKKALEVKGADVPPGIEEEAVPPDLQEDFLVQKGPRLIAEGKYDRVLDLIKELPASTREHTQIQILECFANLKGWVSVADENYKSNWWTLRQQLLHVGDTEATPLIMAFFKDEDPWMRKYAAELLGYIGDDRAVNDLRELAEHDEDAGVRKYATWAYEQIFGERM